MSQTCQYRHSLNQSLVAHTVSATGSDHSLDAAVAGALRDVSSLYATNTAVQSVAVLQPSWTDRPSLLVWSVFGLHLLAVYYKHQARK
eukprot:6178587-Pleurochrysis_carterae.AAC.1